MTALSFPLPFLTALLAGILALRIIVTAEGVATARVIFAALFAAMALRALMVGLRFGYGIGAAAALQPVLAMLVPPLAWLGFRAMTASPPAFGWRDWALHGAPVALVALGVAVLAGSRWAWWVVDVAVMASYVGYSVPLLGLYRRGPAAFSRLDPAVVPDARRQLLVLAVLMLASAGVDGGILVGVARGGEVPLAPIVGGNAFGLAVLVLLLVLAPQRMLGTVAARVLPTGLSKRAQSADTEGDAALVERLEALMATGLFRDPGLDAARLARRLGVPQRRLSEAVNGRLGRNVSQYVNGRRIDEACRRLAAGDEAVTEIMLAVGFETKSNFNREFRRVTGTSPTEWRRARRAGDAGEPSASDGAPTS